MSAEVDISEFLTTRTRGEVCSFAKLKLSELQQRKLAAALKSTEVATAQIHRILNQWGHSISPHTVGRHRRGECSCPTS